MELSDARTADVGGMPVRRALPQRTRRTVGGWCFVDHFGPVDADQSDLMQVGPHPHIGLQTVTWLLKGEVLHTDSLGSEQVIRPGQLNLMTAGAGIAHAESARPSDGAHGVQLWIAQPEETRHGAPAFEHHGSLPALELDNGVATVLVGELGGTRSPARHDTPLVGADLALAAGAAEVPLDATWEHAVVVAEGAVEIDGTAIVPGRLAHLDPGRDSVHLGATEPSRVMLIGGQPFGEKITMWWNFVARDRSEIEEARADWMRGGPRFGDVKTPLGRIDAPETVKAAGISVVRPDADPRT